MIINDVKQEQKKTHKKLPQTQNKVNLFYFSLT